MVKLTLIKGKKKEKPTDEFFANKYGKIIERTLDEIINLPDIDNIPKLTGLVGKLYLSRIRYCCYAYEVISKKKNGILKSEIDDLLLCFEEALKSLKTLTPKEFITLFPITKNYDGEKYECLDYFSTIELFKNIQMDKPLIDINKIDDLSEKEFAEKDKQINLLIMEYQNKDIRKFNIKYLLLTSMKMRMETGKDLADTLVEKYPELKGSKYTYFVDSKGKKVWVNSLGKTFREKPVIPKGWKVIK